MTDISRQEFGSSPSESRLPYPQGVDDQTNSEVRALLLDGKPLYYAIGKVIRRETDELHRLIDARYYARGGIRGMLTEKTEGIAYAREMMGLEMWGYGMVGDVLEEAFIIAQTNGEPENHPDFDDIRHTSDMVHSRHVLEVMSNGDSGIDTLLEEKLQEISNPDSEFYRERGSIEGKEIIPGIMQGIKRYNELTDYFSRNH